MATPWGKIRAEWLKGGITHQELADKYHVSVKTIQNHAYKEGWGKEKGKIREKVEEETRGRIVRARVNHLEKLIEAQEALLAGMVDIIRQVQENPKLLVDKSGSLRNAESLAKALQVATMTQRDLYRLPNIDQKFAEKKWKAEQKAKKDQASEASGTVWEIITSDGEPIDE